MSITAKTLIQSKFAASSTTTEYTTPVSTRTIIDKFSATNIDSGSLTVSVYIVPSGQSAGTSNLIIKEHSISAGATFDATELKNHILATGDFIAVVASSASKIVIRAAGREVT